MIALVDADIVTFRGAFSAEDEPEAWIACSRTEGILREIAETTGCTSMELWLSGPDNFRYGIYPEYKANRIKTKRPRWEHEVKEFLTKSFSANWSQGCEADDMLGVRQMELGDNSVLCTIDKDLWQIPGWKYNFVKKEKSFVTPEEGIRFFYYQCLVGDTADGIKGVPNVGPVKANKLLDAATAEALREGTEVERALYNAVVDQFSCYEEFLMNAQVLHIWQKPGDIWIDKFKKEGMDTSEEESIYRSCAKEREPPVAS